MSDLVRVFVDDVMGRLKSRGVYVILELHGNYRGNAQLDGLLFQRLSGGDFIVKRVFNKNKVNRAYSFAVGNFAVSGGVAQFLDLGEPGAGAPSIFRAELVSPSEVGEFVERVVDTLLEYADFSS